MGVRANYIIRNGDTHSIYFSQFGADAQVMGRCLLAGPESMLEYVKAQLPVEELLDEVTCEGGAFIDSTAQRLVWFACADLSPPYRRALWPEIVRHWPGWRIEWAEEGVLNLARSAGLSEQLLEQDECVHPTMAELDEDDEEGTSLLTICQTGEQPRDICFQSPISEVLAQGPSLVRSVRHRRQALPREDELSEGALIDCLSRSVHLWWASAANSKIISFLEQVWPQWTVKRQDVGLRLQLELSGRPTHDSLITPQQANSWLQSLLQDS